MKRHDQSDLDLNSSSASANQGYENHAASEVLQPPSLQLKAEQAKPEGENDNGEIQLMEKEYSAGAAENPSDESNSNNQPFQLKSQENNTGLPDNLKSGVENLSGFSMDDVKVHYNSDKPAKLQAHAYAQGTDIYLGTGQEKHLPHEAWHVVQQKQGRVKPTIQDQGVSINDDKGLEREAEDRGKEAGAWLSSRKREGEPKNLREVKKIADAQIAQRTVKNVKAKFRTDNKHEEIPNSEYRVTKSGYERYAPLNLYSAPDQIYHESKNRTFIYFKNMKTRDNVAKLMSLK